MLPWETSRASCTAEKWAIAILGFNFAGNLKIKLETSGRTLDLIVCGGSSLC
jgi:hypothetical protein